jgi:hypothetical protein
MIMADVFTVLFVILGFWLLYPACCLMARSLAPDRVEAARDYVAAHPYRSFGWGLVVWAPSILGISVLAQGPGPLKLAALFGFAALMAHTFLGLAGLATRIGEGIGSPLDADRPWLATVRGMVCLQIPGTLPILGWFVVAPTAFMLGAGAAWRTRKAEAPAPAPEVAPAEIASEGAPA